MTDKAIFIQNLSKSYGEYKAVENLSFEINNAECFGFLGPNGAGKTTTMKILYGKSNQDRCSKTKIDIFGHDPQMDALTIKSFSGIVPQEDNLDTALNVTDNLILYSKFYGMPKEAAKKRIVELLEFMELSDKGKSKVGELSGGMKRRLTIARALLNNPKLLILDEPTTGLDPQVRHLIWNKLRELKELGVTILLTTHYMEEAFQICDRILIMDKGKKMIEGNPRELISKNLEKFVMEIYGICKDNNTCIKLLTDSKVRYEFNEDTLFAFSDDMDKLSKIREILKESDYYIRHCNLEDLFLKVTGRALNDLQ